MNEWKRYGVIADTHGALPPRIFELFAGVEAILHAGDVGDERILDDLETIAPVFAVQGNCDAASARLPLLRVLEFDMGKIVLVHSHIEDPMGAHPEILADCFASHAPKAIVFGHSHKPFSRLVGGIWLFNPGSALRPRAGSKASAGLMRWNAKDDRLDFEHIAL